MRCAPPPPAPPLIARTSQAPAPRAHPPAPLFPLPRSFTASAADAALFAAIGTEPDAKKFPNVARFFKHIASLSAEARAALPAAIGGAGAGGKPAAAAKPVAKAEEEDDGDLFGDDGDAVAAKKAAPAPAAAAAPAKKEKVKPIAKTICVYECKPSIAETQPPEMEAAIRSIKMDGLNWGETFKVEEIGWGIKKLVVQFVVEDDKVSLFDLEDVMLALPSNNKDDETGEDLTLFQSVDQMSMNKLG